MTMGQPMPSTRRESCIRAALTPAPTTMDIRPFRDVLITIAMAAITMKASRARSSPRPAPR